MRLMLMRHGHAEGHGMDPSLAEHGVQAVQRTLEAPWPEPARIVHSPLLRAAQTAALLSARWPAAERVVDAAFAPEMPVDVAARRLLELGEDCTTVALVSHLPLLPALCHWFTDARREFEPADAVLLEADGALAWRGAFVISGEPR